MSEMTNEIMALVGLPTGAGYCPECGKPMISSEIQTEDDGTLFRTVVCPHCKKAYREYFEFTGRKELRDDVDKQLPM